MEVDYCAFVTMNDGDASDVRDEFYEFLGTAYYFFSLFHT